MKKSTITNILPKDLKTLISTERDTWIRVQLCFDKIRTQFKVEPATKPQIDEFHLFTSKIKPLHFSAWNILKEDLKFKLCLIQYDYLYTLAGPTGGSVNTDRSLYFFGQLNLNIDVGVCIIRPETWEDKISDLFIKADIDFETYPLFSYKFYVTGQEKEKLLDNLPATFFKFMETVGDLQIEFRNNKCLFRLPKSIDSIEVEELCSIGLKLDKILNFDLVKSNKNLNS